MHLAALRRALLPTLVAAAALMSVAPAAGAQTVQMYYAPACGPGTPCTLLRFQLGNDTNAPMLFNTLTLTASGAPFAFAPASGGAALYQAVDAIGPFGGAGLVAPGGTSIFIDFLGGNGFAFELTPRRSGYVEIALDRTPGLTASAFTFEATLDGGRTVSGSVAVIPEPTTVVLLATGLGAIGLAARRRRRG